MSSNPVQPLVSIGLPVYNQPQLLRKALECLTQQSYKNLEIIVSDDCSPGESTQMMVKEFAEKDARVKNIRQEKNLGPVLNHKFVFEKATGEYFFWASEDDEWSEKYFEIGLKTLMSNPYYDAWCCTIRNTDSFGRVIREYPGFSRWTSTQNKWKDIVRFLMEPEIMGKPHVFHSIFRRSALGETIKEYWFNDKWGTDMCFGLAFLARYNLIATDEVLFDKRVVRPTDNEKHVDHIVIKSPSRHIFPLDESITYIHEYYKAVRTTPYKYIAVLIMLIRLPIAIRNDVFSIQALKKLLYKVAYMMKRLLLKASHGVEHSDLFWRQKFGYESDPQTINVRWAIVYTHGVINVPLNILRAPIVTPTGIQLMPIEDTPHYPWIKSLVEGSEDVYLRDKYRSYLEAYYPEEDTTAGLDQVVALVSTFQSGANRDSLITIVTHTPTRYQGSDYIVIYDGVHRSAIAKALGHESIKCRLVTDRINSHDFACRILHSQNMGLS